MENIKYIVPVFLIALLSYFFINQKPLKELIAKHAVEPAEPLSPTTKLLDEADKLLKVKGDEHNHDKVDNICVNFSDGGCILDPVTNIKHYVVDQETGALKAKSANIIIESDNYYEVLQYQALNYKTEVGKQNFDKYSRQLYSALDSSLSSVSLDNRGLQCSDEACGFSLTYSNKGDWTAFKELFVSGNRELGNLFVSHTGSTPKEVRLMFFPGNYSAIMK